MRSLVFIISPPRSGSTLLQRILSGHEKITSLSEISLLLRFLGSPNDVIRYADYRESNLEIAKEDIRDAWPDFDEAYHEQIRALMYRIYEGVSNGAPIFIDKTPRYTLIVEEIYKCFPDAKFIVLWRHPLAIAASISKTFFEGTWYFDDFEIDLSRGLERLNSFDQPNRERVFSLRYEDFVRSTSEVLSDLGEFLEVENLNKVLARPLSRTNSGKLGDPTGINKYDHISAKSLDSWIEAYDCTYRKQWAKDFFEPSRTEWLKARGYELPTNLPSHSGPTDWKKSIGEYLHSRKMTKRRSRGVLRVFEKYSISRDRHLSS